MTTRDSVVVGIDGSNAAIGAAQWAVREAVARELPLRLVFAANTTRTRGDVELTGPDVDYGKDALQAAAAAVDAMDQPVKVETEIVWGPPSNVLVEQSRNAALVCVGTVGIGALARAVLGSVATSVAERAHCPVAVVRPASGDKANYVAVGIDDDADADRVIAIAAKEALSRRADLVLVAQGCNAFGANSEERAEQRVESWRGRYPGLGIEVFETEGTLAGFLGKHHTELAHRYAKAAAADGAPHPLAVLGQPDMGELTRIVGPHDHALFRHPICSVLVTRRPE